MEYFNLIIIVYSISLSKFNSACYLAVTYSISTQLAIQKLHRSMLKHIMYI